VGEHVCDESVDPAFFQDARARDGKMLAYQKFSKVIFLKIPYVLM
jgi:hypothetical protein